MTTGALQTPVNQRLTIPSPQIHGERCSAVYSGKNTSESSGVAAEWLAVGECLPDFYLQTVLELLKKTTSFFLQSYHLLGSWFERDLKQSKY